MATTRDLPTPSFPKFWNVKALKTSVTASLILFGIATLVSTNMQPFFVLNDAQCACTCLLSLRHLSSSFEIMQSLIFLKMESLFGRAAKNFELNSHHTFESR